MMIVDSHCHLNYEGLRDDMDGVVNRARAAGIGAMLTINTKLREYDEVRAIAERYDDIYCSVGVHPHEAETEAGVAAHALIDRAQHAKTIGIGETGLDYYYDNAPRNLQKGNFLAHIEAARETQLPVIIHTRDADDDTAEILRTEMGKGAFPGVIHCFTASRGFAETALELGFYISLSGIVTFKNAKDLQATARIVPEDRLLVETDAPFLAPAPMRGKTCEPAYVAHTVKFIAGLRDVTPETLAETTTENFFRLFNKARRPAVA